MSFGYSVGDLITVVQLAYKVYDSCKTSVDEYKDIGRDVGNTHLVLGAIQRYWKAEEARGRDLIVAQQEDLKQLAENSHGILEKIQEVLDKHRSLGTRGRVRDKLKWTLSSFVTDIGPQRQALQENTHALAIFNATLTAENASGVADQQIKVLEEHSQLLKFLVTRYFEYQTGVGNRMAPAFSQVAVKDIEEDEDDSWGNIDSELEEAGFDSMTVKEHRGLIREWITTVIPDDDDKVTVQLAGSTIAEEDDSPPVAEVVGVKLSENKKDGEGGKKEVDAPAPPSRPESASSRRSQASTWREVETKSSGYVAEMLAKVLTSKYGEDSDDLYRLPIRRAFNYLDWTDRGWISIAEVQKHCHQAARIAKFSLDGIDLTQLAKQMDVDDDNQVGLDEFIEIVVKLRQMIMESVILVKSNLAGRNEAGVELKKFFDTTVDELMLPFGWNKMDPTSSGHREYRHVLLHNLLGTKQSMAPLQFNFSNAAFLATGHCASKIASALKHWRVALVGMPKEEAAEYTEALNNVLTATAKFHIFDANYLPSKLHLLDYCADRINVIPPNQLQPMRDWPALDLTVLREKCWKILDPILGFVYDLRTTGFPELDSTPMSLREWSRLRMLERSRRISHDLLHWDGMKKDLKKCQEWCDTHNSDLDAKAKLAIGTAKELYRIQQEGFHKTDIHRIRIQDVSLQGLKQDHFRRDPVTFFAVGIDGYLHDSESASESAIQATSPSWWHGRFYDVTKDSKVQLEFHDVKSKIKISKLSKMYSESFIGYFDFQVAEITNFNGVSTVTKRGALKLPQNSKLEASVPEVSVQVYTDWKTGSTDWESSKAGTLAEEISCRPLPPDWEVRRTEDDDVYFVNLKTSQSTARLWQATVTSHDSSAELLPLPEGWTVAESNGKVTYLNHEAKAVENPPEQDCKSTFRNVIRAKSFCQLDQFFSQKLIDRYNHQSEKQKIKKR